VEATKLIKNCLKSTFVSEITRIKVSKKGNFFSFRFAMSRYAVLEWLNRSRAWLYNIGRRYGRETG
jgi:hypothetical protein